MVSHFMSTMMLLLLVLAKNIGVSPTFNFFFLKATIIYACVKAEVLNSVLFTYFEKQ